MGKTKETNTRMRQRLVVMLFCALGSWSPISAQVLPPTILEIDVDNLVEYFEDTSDLSKFATGPNPIAAASPRNFNFRVGIGDIIAINGQPAKGTLTRNNRQVLLRTAPVTGQSIADTVRGAVHSDTIEIVKNDGTQIGTIMSYGLGLGPPPTRGTFGNNSSQFGDHRGYRSIYRGAWAVGPGGDSDIYYCPAGLGNGGPNLPPSQRWRAGQVRAPGDPDVAAANFHYFRWASRVPFGLVASHCGEARQGR